MPRQRVRLLLSLLCAAACAAQVADRLPERWKANWIACPDAPAREAGVYHFRKVFQLAEKPQRFIIHVTADNHFLLHVNGKRVGDGPALADPAHWHFETYDLAPFLNSGENVIAATVWNYGERAPLSQMSLRTGFLLQGAGDSEQVVNTDASWEAKREPAIEFLPTTWNTIHQYYAATPGERLDGKQFDWQWDSTLSSGWSHAIMLSAGAMRGAQDAPNGWALTADELPPMEWSVIPTGRVVRQVGIDAAAFPIGPVVLPPQSRASILIDAGALTTAYPELIVSDGAAANIRLTYSEALYDEQNHKANRNEIGDRDIIGVWDEFIPEGGRERTFMPVAWRTWRYLQLDVETQAQPLTLERLTTHFTAFPFVERAKFNANNDVLARIWQTGWRTARLCAHDTYMDTPYWERLQYGGDTRIQMLISYTVAGDDRLARQAIEALDASRIPDGITQSRYPSALPQHIPTFSLLWIGMLHDYWLYRPDAAYLRRFLRGERDVLAWFADFQRADGLLGRLPWWNFVDWTDGFRSGVPPQDDNGGSAVITLQFIAALREAADLETALGDRTLAERYRTVADKAAAGMRAKCWNRRFGLLADTPAHTHFSQHANALGVLLDVIPHEQQRDVLSKILSVSDAGFQSNSQLPPMSKASYYFRFYIARALDHAGMADRYLDLLGPWRQMLDLGLTTWAETPEPTRSDSHAWSAHPNYDLLTLVAGMKPASPGFREVTIEPHLGSLNQLDSEMPHPSGSIAVAYRATSTGMQAQVVLPSDVRGTFVWRGRSYPLHSGAQTLNLPH